MDYRVATGKGPPQERNVSDVPLDLLQLRMMPYRIQYIPTKKIKIQYPDRIALLQQPWDQDSPHVPRPAGHQNL
jgi:hypothetical protein